MTVIKFRKALETQPIETSAEFWAQRHQPDPISKLVEDAEQKGFESGAWAAWNHVMNWLNTEESRTLQKKYVYDKILDMRPDKIKRALDIAKD